jgi:hypothetical protein
VYNQHQLNLLLKFDQLKPGMLVKVVDVAKPLSTDKEYKIVSLPWLEFVPVHGLTLTHFYAIMTGESEIKLVRTKWVYLSL